MPTREQTQQLLGAAIGDKYDVMQWIGGGGMAGVYLARHRLHGGFCAVKVLADHLAQDSGIVDQFLHEARTAANLDGHPNVVRIVDIGENEGLHYLIMQYVEGEDLATYLQRAGRLSPAETAYCGAQIADALCWAHSKGVVHRDLKPANVRLDMQGRLIVLDFGIAKIGSMPTALTQMGFKVGTPHYMAPEQIRGQPIDHRADLYSLGVMMYEMVIGKRPFGGETNEAIWHAHVATPPPVPHEVDPGVPQPIAEPPPEPPAAVLPDIVETPTGTMRLIRAGEFVFGAANDVTLPIERPAGFESPNPRQTLKLGDYYMDLTEVSNRVYKQFCDATGRAYPLPPYFDENYFESKPDHPVINISFDDAEAFAEWANKRLPTEQEWEKAARGVDGRLYPWGNSLPTTHANSDGAADGFENLAPVTSAPEGASPNGMLNMSGNVWEWTASLYQPSPQEVKHRVEAWKQVGVAWTPGAPWFVIKGGAFDTPRDDLDLMLFFRAANPSDIQMPYGFRCAMDPPKK